MILPIIGMVPEIDNGELQTFKTVCKYEYFRLYGSTESVVPRINSAVVL